MRSIVFVFVVRSVPIDCVWEELHAMFCQFCSTRKVEASLPLSKSKESQTLARIYAQNRTGVKAVQNGNGLLESFQLARTLRDQKRVQTSWTDVLAAPITRNANTPGTKLIPIAASGVWPLLVRPTVSLMNLNELLRARKKIVRLET